MSDDVEEHAEARLSQVQLEIRELSADIDAQEDRHRRRRQLYLEARELGMLTRDIATLSSCTKEAVTLQLRRARTEMPVDA